MSTIRDKGKVQLECDYDGCTKTTEVYNADDFTIMMKDAKADGWLTFKNDDEKWVNVCQWGPHGPAHEKQLAGGTP